MQEAGERIGDWLKKHVSDPIERNPARILVVAGALLVAVTGYVNPGTFLNTISAELFGIVIAAVIVDFVNERRQESERKQILIAMFGSSQRDVAEAALIELRNRKWLYDGSLEGADLSQANLVGANLFEANLNYCNMNEAKLMDADLSSAKLHSGSLFRTRFENAHLPNAEFAGANLFGAHLERALMLSANLNGANLTRAHLNNANLLGSDLKRADFSFSDLTGARFEAANLEEAVFNGANLTGADLRRAYNWTIAQLESASTLEDARMPGLNMRQSEDPETWSIGEWKTRILRDHGGMESTRRDMNGIPVDEDR